MGNEENYTGLKHIFIVTDTIVANDSVGVLENPADSVSPEIQLSEPNTEIKPLANDSVFIRLEQREKSFQQAQKIPKKVEINPAEVKDTTDYVAMANRNFPLTPSGNYKSLNIPTTYNLSLKPSPVYIETATKSIETGMPYTPHFVYKDAFLFIFFVLVMLLAWIKTGYKKYLQDVLVVPFNPQISSKIFRDKNIIHKRIFTILNIINVLILSLLIYQGCIILETNILKNQGFFEYFKIVIIVSGITFGRYMLNHFVGSVFKVKTEIMEFIHSTLMINKSLGLILIPLTFILLYVSYTLQLFTITLSALIIVIMYFVRILRGIQVILRTDVFIFYSLLYLCTLEILPVLVGYKIIKDLV